MADKPMSGMATVSSLAGTERLLSQGADGYVILVSAIAAYTIDELVGAAALTPGTGDALLMERSGTEGTFDIDALASYVVATGWSVASEADPAVSGDMILANRSGVIYELDIDTIQTYVLVGVQATVLDLSGLDAATLSGTDLFAVCQTTTGKKVTLTNLETKLWTDFQTYVEGLTAVATATSSDYFYSIQGGVPKLMQADELSVYMDTAIIALGNVQTSAFSAIPANLTALSEPSSVQDADELLMQRSGTAYKMTMATVANYAMDATFELPWKLISTDKYTALPPYAHQLTMSDTSDISIGDPIKFTWSGTTYYAYVTAVAANSLITIAGAPFSTTISLSELYVGTPDQRELVTVFVPSLFGDDEYDMLSTLGRYMRWEGPPAYLVGFNVTCGEADSGASQPKVNVKVDSALVSTADSNNGVQVSGTPGTWTECSAVAINTTNYAIIRGDAIEIRCTAAGTTGDAADLTVNLIFVYE